MTKKVDIKGFEGSYYITEDGEVHSYDRYINGRTVRAKKMSLVSNGTGYLQVTLNLNSERFKFYIHRLVWTSFNGDIPEGMEIDHYDEDKSNNKLCNLRLVTRKENMEKCLASNPHILYNLINNCPDSSVG